MAPLVQAWLLHGNTRRIILNKERQSQVVNVQNKGSKFITTKCMVLYLGMSEDPASLTLRAGGSGKVFRLALMQGLQPVSDIPTELDFVPGAINNTCVQSFWLHYTYKILQVFESLTLPNQ